MGNFLADVGRSQAIPQFLEQARLARKDEAGIAAESERLNLLKQESGRADVRLAREGDLNVEAMRIAKATNDEKIQQIEEGNKTLPWSSVSEIFPSKGVADFATQYFKAKGQLNEEGPEPGVKSKHFDELSQKINPKSDKYDIAIATQVNGIHLNSVAQKKAYIQKAMEDPEAFKAFKAQFPEVKKPEDLQGMLEQVNQEYGQAFNSYHQITEKDKIMRQEASDKQSELKSYHADLIQVAKDNAKANQTRAGAAVTNAETKAGKVTPSVLSATEHKRAQEIVDGWAEASKSKRALDAEFLKQQGFEIKESEVDVENKWTKGTHKEKVYDLVAIVDKQTSETPAKTKDKFGFMLGESKKKDGKTYKYIGNNQWQS